MYRNQHVPKILYVFAYLPGYWAKLPFPYIYAVTLYTLLPKYRISRRSSQTLMSSATSMRLFSLGHASIHIHTYLDYSILTKRQPRQQSALRPRCTTVLSDTAPLKNCTAQIIQVRLPSEMRSNSFVRVLHRDKGRVTFGIGLAVQRYCAQLRC